MTVTEDDVARALRRLTPAPFVCGVRRIFAAPILPAERGLYVGVVDAVRDRTATGRLLARELLGTLDRPARPIGRGVGGAPDFGEGVFGSIAHDDDFAVCVVGAGGHVGVDVEPAIGLPAEIVSDVCGAGFVGDGVSARVVFAAKEAVFKACFPVEGVVYEFADVVVEAVDDCRFVARTRTGRAIDVFTTHTPRILAVAVFR